MIDDIGGVSGGFGATVSGEARLMHATDLCAK